MAQSNGNAHRKGREAAMNENYNNIIRLPAEMNNAPRTTFNVTGSFSRMNERMIVIIKSNANGNHKYITFIILIQLAD